MIHIYIDWFQRKVLYWASQEVIFANFISVCQKSEYILYCFCLIFVWYCFCLLFSWVNHIHVCSIELSAPEGNRFTKAYSLLWPGSKLGWREGGHIYAGYCEYTIPVHEPLKAGLVWSQPPVKSDTPPNPSCAQSCPSFLWGKGVKISQEETVQSILGRK